MKILVVDDEVAILETLEILFRGEGYEVSVADSGSLTSSARQPMSEAAFSLFRT